MKLARGLAAFLFTAAMVMCIMLLPVMVGATNEVTEPSTGTTLNVTEAPTEAPTDTPTEAPTEEPTEDTTVCSHDFGPWQKEDDDKHTRTCQLCQEPETEDHTWNQGEVTETPNCQAGGKKVYTCTGCEATKEEDLPVSTEHNYGPWENINITSHKHTCQDCNLSETDFHLWNDGITTREPDCMQEGETTYTCTICSGTITEPIEKLTTHTYDNDCDPDCNVENCPETRTVTHSYKDYWSMDKDNHWYNCSICGHITQEAPHTPGAAATETTAQTCTDCGYVITPALGHTHRYSNTLTYDGTSHWYACSGCSTKKDVSNHRYSNNCDSTCNSCGYTRNVSHNYSQQWYYDSTSHYHSCTVCGNKKDVADHVPNAAPTETTDQVCTICSYMIAPALGHTHNFGAGWFSDATNHWHSCTCGQTVDLEAHKWSGGLCSVCGTDDPNATEPPTTVPTTEPQPTEPTTATPRPAPAAEDDSMPLWIPIVLLILVIGALLAYIIIHKGL